MQAAVGLAFLAGGWWVHRNDSHQRVHWMETAGTIVDRDIWRQRDLGKKDFLQPDTYTVTYAPVVEFTVNQRKLRFKGSYDSTPPSLGNQVVVRYDPAAPESSARVVDPFEGLTPWAMAALGLYAAGPALWSMARDRATIESNDGASPARGIVPGAADSRSTHCGFSATTRTKRAF
jgi:hypothetical protein